MAGAPFNRCIHCNDVISNPLCTSCLAERMIVSVGETNLKIARLIAGFKVDGDTKCISCGEMMGLCANCFSKDIYEFLSEKEPQIATMFLGHFDFDLRRNNVRRYLD